MQTKNPSCKRLVASRMGKCPECGTATEKNGDDAHIQCPGCHREWVIRGQSVARRLNEEERAWIVNNMGLAGEVARKAVRKRMIDWDEAQSAAYMGLCRSPATYDPDGGGSLVTHATWSAYYAVGDEIRETIGIMRGRSPTCRECGSKIESEANHVQCSKCGEVQDNVVFRALSFTDVIVFNDKSSSVEDRTDFDPADYRNSESEANLDDILSALDSIDPRHAKVVKMRLAGKKLHEIGNSLGVTKERVRQLETEAHEQIRKHLGIEDESVEQRINRRREFQRERYAKRCDARRIAGLSPGVEVACRHHANVGGRGASSAQGTPEEQSSQACQGCHGEGSVGAS